MKLLVNREDIPLSDASAIETGLESDFSEVVVVFDNKDSIQFSKRPAEKFTGSFLIKGEKVKKVPETRLEKARVVDIIKSSLAGDKSWEEDMKWDVSSTSHMGCLVAAIGLLLLSSLFFYILI